MKAKRRHELQENILAQEIGKVAEFLKKRGNHLATAALVAALIFAGYKLLSGWSQRTQMNIQRDWERAAGPEGSDPMTAETPDRISPEERTKLLATLAEQDDNERIAALASVKLGNLYAMWALRAAAPSEAAALREKASYWYLQAIEKHPKEKLAVAKARYGLGNLRESMRQFAQAGEEYRLAKADPELAGQPVVQLAETALRQLKTLQDTEVYMAATRPASQPAIPPAPGPAGTQPGPLGPTTQPGSPVAVQSPTQPGAAAPATPPVTPVTPITVPPATQPAAPPVTREAPPTQPAAPAPPPTTQPAAKGGP